MRMPHRYLPEWVAVTFILSLFVITLSYSGAGYNLHLLSLWGLLLLAWFSTSIIRLDFSHAYLAWGWLPLIIIMYFGWLLLAPSLSGYPYASFTRAMALAVMPLVFLGWLLISADKQKTWDLTWNCLLLCGIAMAIWGMGDFLVLGERAHASFLDPNAYAALINLLLIPTIYLYFGTTSSQYPTEGPKPLLIVVALLALAQAMSLSRGALLVFLITLLVVLWLRRNTSTFWSRLPWLLCVLVLANLLVKFAPIAPRQGIETFLLGPDQVMRDSSIRERLLLTKSTWKMVEDTNPMFGSGLGTFKILYPAYRDPDERSSGNFAHNDYLQALQEGGIIQLGFFLALAVVTPVWLLYKYRSRSDHRNTTDDSDIVPGLLLGVACASLHALVNFIHYVGPLSFLIGLYAARSWEAVQPHREFRLSFFGAAQVKQGFLKAFVLLIFAVPIAILTADGIIFKLFATDKAIHTRMDPDGRVVALNLALAIRPGNPMPRILLIRALISEAEKSDSEETRHALLSQAERESTILAAQAPALALAKHYFPGKILALRASPTDLVEARSHFEKAVRLVPPATTMRRELVKIYIKLGQNAQAHRTVIEAKQWVRFEVDLSSLAMFAREAQTIAVTQNDPGEASYWAGVQSQISELKKTGKLTNSSNPVE